MKAKNMKITVPIDAVPQGRPRVVNRIAFDPEKSRQFKKDFATLVQLLNSGANFFTGAVKVDIKVYRQSSKFKSVTVRQYGDADNIAKGILDACKGILWHDDAQVADLHITKNLADKPRVELSVEEIKMEERSYSELLGLLQKLIETRRFIDSTFRFYEKEIYDDLTAVVDDKIKYVMALVTKAA